MSGFDVELIKAVGITATAVGKYLNLSPQSMSNGVRTKKNFISEEKIAILQGGLIQDGEDVVLEKLNLFLQSQQQTPMHRFYLEHEVKCFTNMLASEFRENVDWIVGDFVSGVLKSDLVVLTPHVEEIKKLIITKSLSTMSVESARQGVNNNIILIYIDEMFSPIIYTAGNTCFVCTDAQSFVELPKVDSAKIKRGIETVSNSLPILTNQWSTRVIPFMVLLQEVKTIMNVETGELLGELIAFFQNNNASIDSINWGLLALRLQSENKAYQCLSKTPYDQLVDFIAFVSNSTGGEADTLVSLKEADDIKRCLKAVKLISI